MNPTVTGVSFANLFERVKIHTLQVLMIELATQSFHMTTGFAQGWMMVQTNFHVW